MEKWDIYDENRKPLNKQHERGKRMIPGEYHNVVGIWVVNDKNEILLTLRHQNKEEYPGLWENTGGSALAGETSRQGAVRELFEETGIKAEQSELAYLGTNKTQSAFVDLYALRKNIETSELIMQDDETSAAKWVTLKELYKLAEQGELAEPVAIRLKLLRKEFEHFLFRGNLKEKQYILFDLDGTLTDSAQGIINSVAYAMEKFGLEITDKNELYAFIGPPLWETFEKELNLSKEETDLAVKYFREYYKDRGVYENKVYEGVEELLKNLRHQGKSVILATSKAEYFAEKVLQHFNLSEYFDFIAGSNLDGTRAKKDEVIAYALEKCSIETGQAVMIGDREQDIIGAKRNSLDTIGVLYGYGDYEELQYAGAVYIASDVKELVLLLM